MVDSAERPERPKPVFSKSSFMTAVFYEGRFRDTHLNLSTDIDKHTEIVERHFKYNKDMKVVPISAHVDQASHELNMAFRESLGLMLNVWEDFPVQDMLFHNTDWCRHFVEVSEKGEGNISYFQSEEKRAVNVRTPIKPGRYLQKFFGDFLTEKQIQEMAIAFTEYAKPPELFISQDADVVEAVYRNGPNSCMKKNDSQMKSLVQPTRVYGGPDLGIAYIGSLEKPTGRAVVWPEKQLYGRRYGDIERITIALNASGYKEGSFEGARIQKIWDDRYEAFVVPYIDAVPRVREVGDYLVLDSGGKITARETHGLGTSNPQRRMPCEMCDRVFPEHELRDTPDDMIMCRSCRAVFYFTCDYTGDLYPIEQAKEGRYGIKYGPDAPTFFCEGSKTYTLDNNGRQRITMFDNSIWSRDWFDDYGFTDPVTKKNYPESMGVEYEDLFGAMVSHETIDDHADKLLELVTSSKSRRDNKALVSYTVESFAAGYELPIIDIQEQSGYVVIDISMTGHGGHDCDGLAPHDNGWFVPPSDLRPLNEEARRMIRDAKAIWEGR